MYVNDSSTVFYCQEDDCIPLTRDEVWSKIDGLPGYIDTVMAFNPVIGFEVFKINVKKGISTVDTTKLTCLRRRCYYCFWTKCIQ